MANKHRIQACEFVLARRRKYLGFRSEQIPYWNLADELRLQLEEWILQIMNGRRLRITALRA